MDMSGVEATYPIPPIFDGLTLDQWAVLGEPNCPDGWKTFQEWFKDFDRHILTRRTPVADRPNCGGGIVLYGPPGTGKTSLAAAALTNLLDEHRKTVAFVSDGSLETLLRSQMQGTMFDADDEALLMGLTRVACVVLDDYFRLSSHNPGGKEWLLRQRLLNGRPTIITLNENVKVSDVMSSLLSAFTWAEFRGQDLRTR